MVDVRVPEIFTVKARTSMQAVVYDNDGRIRHEAQVTWIFGDGAERSGEVVRHAYREPGQYALVVRARAGKGFAEKVIPVRAEEALLEVADVFGRGVRISNKHERLFDLSSWVLKADREEYVLPNGTYLLPETGVIFPSAITRISASSTVALYYPEELEPYEEEAVSDSEVARVQPSPVNRSSHTVRETQGNGLTKSGYGNGTLAPTGRMERPVGALSPFLALLRPLVGPSLLGSLNPVS